MTGDFELARDNYRVMGFDYNWIIDYEMKVCMDHTKGEIKWQTPEDKDRRDE